MRCLVLVLALSLFALPARAQTEHDREQAKKYFAIGNAAYRAGKYDAAVRAFGAAYDLAPQPALAFSLAQACRRQYFVDGDPRKLERAVELFKLYLKQAPDGRRRADAVDILERLEPRLAILEAQTATTAGAEPVEVVHQTLIVSSNVLTASCAVDGGEPRSLPAFVDVDPGDHEIRVYADGFFDDVRTVPVEKGSDVPVYVALAERPARLRVKVQDGAAVRIDGVRVGTTPLAKPLELRAGTYQIELSSSGHRAYRQSLRLDRGDDVRLVTELDLTQARRVSYWTIGAGAGLTIAAMITLGVTLFFEDEAIQIQDKRAMENLTAAEAADFNRNLSRRDDLRVVTFTLFGTAAASGIVGGILYLLDEG